MSKNPSAERQPELRPYRIFDRLNRELLPRVWAYSAAQAAGFYAKVILGDPSCRWDLTAEEITPEEQAFAEEFADSCHECGYRDLYSPQAQIACPNCAS